MSQNARIAPPDGEEDFCAWLRNIRQTINETNCKLVDQWQGSQAEGTITEKERLKMFFSESVMEDLEFLRHLNGSPVFLKRHADAILRQLLEQIIEFLYLICHPDEIPAYFGEHANWEALEQSDGRGDDPFKKHRRLITTRYGNGKGKSKDARLKIQRMADSIDRRYKHDGIPPLYQIYQQVSNDMHHAYFLSFLDTVGMAEGEPLEPALTEDQIMWLRYAVDYFFDGYLEDCSQEDVKDATSSNSQP